MKRLDIRFRKESEKKRAAAQLEMLAKLSEKLPLRIEEKFKDVNVRIRLSSEGGYDISGFKEEEKKKFLEYLEELWNDDSLLE